MPPAHDPNQRLDTSSEPEKKTHDEHLLEVPGPEDIAFIHSDPWRVLRVMSEFVKGFDELAGLGPAVTIFGSARADESDPLYAKARETARLLGDAGFPIITGGGPGFMEAANHGAKEAGVPSIGLNIELPFEQHINPYVERQVQFHYFFVRKTMLVKYAQGFVIFPGGFGTMDELFEALTLIQTGKVRNFPVVLFGTEYWRGLLDWLGGAMLEGGKIGPADLKLLLLTDSPAEVRDIIVAALRREPWREQQEAGARSDTRRALGSR